MRDIARVAPAVERGATRADLLSLMPPGPARNGIDCALWDLEAQRTGRSVWSLAGVEQPDRVETAITLLLAPPEDMAEQARTRAGFSTLKLKLGSGDPAGCVRAVRAARPDARLAIDANEAWSAAELAALAPAFAQAGAVLIEQPLPAREDSALAGASRVIPLCADESFHSIDDLPRLAGVYDWVNIKLDKCGGLTAALAIIQAAPRFGVRCMVGCMFATSLAVAPAMVAGSLCDLADLDGPLHLTGDREGAFQLDNGAYIVGSGRLWGVPR